MLILEPDPDRNPSGSISLPRTWRKPGLAVSATFFFLVNKHNQLNNESQQSTQHSTMKFNNGSINTIVPRWEEFGEGGRIIHDPSGK